MDTAAAVVCSGLCLGLGLKAVKGFLSRVLFLVICLVFFFVFSLSRSECGGSRPNWGSRASVKVKGENAVYKRKKVFLLGALFSNHPLFPNCVG